jgi:hypothetical protein
MGESFFLTAQVGTRAGASPPSQPRDGEVNSGSHRELSFSDRMDSNDAGLISDLVSLEVGKVGLPPLLFLRLPAVHESEVQLFGSGHQPRVPMPLVFDVF